MSNEGILLRRQKDEQSKKSDELKEKEKMLQGRIEKAIEETRRHEGEWIVLKVGRVMSFIFNIVL